MAAGPAGLTAGKTGAGSKEERPHPQGIAVLQAPAVLDNVGIKALLAAAKGAKVRPEAAHGATLADDASVCLSDGLHPHNRAIELRTQILAHPKTGHGGNPAGARGICRCCSCTGSVQLARRGVAHSLGGTGVVCSLRGAR